LSTGYQLVFGGYKNRNSRNLPKFTKSSVYNDSVLIKFHPLQQNPLI